MLCNILGEDRTVQGQIFYLLLIPWALSSAAFLFGAMKSYARFTYRHLGNFLELGGPVVLFCLVLLGGFKLVPPAPETFDLAVRASSADTPLITSGQITLDLPGLPHTDIGPDGEANFKGLSAKVRGKPVRVLAKVDGYEEEWLTPTLEDSVLNVKLRRTHPVTVQSIRLIPPPNGKVVKITVGDQNVETSFNELGEAKFNVSGRPGDRLPVEVFINGERIDSNYRVLGGVIEIEWSRRADNRE